MSSLTFGAIRDLPSRVDDDDEDVAAEKRTYHLEGASPTTDCSVLVICACKLSKAFSEVYLVGSGAQKCGDIKEVVESKESDFNTTFEVGQFYNVDDGLVVCHLKSGLLTDYLNDIAEKLLEAAGGGDVVILHSEALVSYKAAKAPPGSTVTKILKTSQWKDTFKMDRLELPNVVTGISAAALTACEFQHKPAVLLINYSESSDSDSMSLSGFSRLFMLSSIKRFESRIPRRDAQEKLKQLAKNSPENLYM